MYRVQAETPFLDLWIARSAELGAIPRSAAELLDQADRDELNIRAPNGRRAFLLSRVMLRLALSARSGREPSSWSFATGLLGRLSVAPSGGGLEISVTHAGDFTAVAVSNVAVGLDVERDGADPESAACCLSVEELARLRSLPCARRHREFLELWTAKEAFSKLTGQGVNRSLSEITLDEISRSAYSTSFGLSGADGRYLLTALTARGSGRAAPAVKVHFLGAGSLFLAGAASARIPWKPTQQLSARQGFPQSSVS